MEQTLLIPLTLDRSLVCMLMVSRVLSSKSACTLPPLLIGFDIQVLLIVRRSQSYATDM